MTMYSQLLYPTVPNTGYGRSNQLLGIIVNAMCTDPNVTVLSDSIPDDTPDPKNKRVIEVIHKLATHTLRFSVTGALVVSISIVTLSDSTKNCSTVSVSLISGTRVRVLFGPNIHIILIRGQIGSSASTIPCYGAGFINNSSPEGWANALIYFTTFTCYPADGDIKASIQAPRYNIVDGDGSIPIIPAIINSPGSSTEGEQSCPSFFGSMGGIGMQDFCFYTDSMGIGYITWGSGAWLAADN